MSTNFSDFLHHPIEIVQGSRYDYSFALLRNPSLMPKAYQLGVDRVKCWICCAFDLLFIINPDFHQYITKLLSSIGVPPKPLVAIQLKTNPSDRVTSLHTAERLLECAEKASHDLHLSGAVWVPVFSDREVEKEVAQHYAQLLTTVHMVTSLSQDNEQAGLQNAFMELCVMLNSTLLVRTKGYRASFGNIAEALRHHYRQGSVSTYIQSSLGCQSHSGDAKIE